MIVFVSFAELRGGAAKSANKLYRACLRRKVNANFLVVEKNSSATDVISPGKIAFAYHFLKRLLAYCLRWLQQDANICKHSLNLFGCSFVVNQLKNYACVHLHWINNETISLTQLAAIRSRIVITLHDEWFYCGSEHLAMDSIRPFKGYVFANKNVRWLDWDRIIWERKKKALFAIKDRVIFTGPSAWIVKRALDSKLLCDFKIRVVPNIIDVAIFSKRSDFEHSTFVEKIPSKSKVILFGAVHGKNMQLKGGHVLFEALSLLAKEIEDHTNVVLVTFGGKAGVVREDLGFKHVEVGVVADAAELAYLYSRAIFTVVPSFVESFGQVAAESLSCETPVVAFECSGLAEIVAHMDTGFLASPYSSVSLCEGMQYLLNLPDEELGNMGKKGRVSIVQRFSEQEVTNRLFAVYREHGVEI
jgi:glycosyltransferase involved in cell wall biosynthesis